jgi:hypothetical protein
MKRLTLSLLASLCLTGQTAAWAGQAPGAASDADTDADTPVSHRDRVYCAEQFSNTASVTDPVEDRLVGVCAIRQVVRGEGSIRRRYPVIAEGHPEKPGPVAQVQLT